MYYDDISPGDKGHSTTHTTLSAAPDTAKGKRAVFDTKLQDYHDNRHNGAYTKCQSCTDVWVFMTDNPTYLR